MEPPEVRAAGIIPYTIKKGTSYFLLVKTNPKGYSDFGGKVEGSEKPWETAAREASEESNGLFDHNDVLEKIGKYYLYLPWAKYALFFYQINELPDPASFGSIELHTGYSLDVVLCNAFERFKLQLHPRIFRIRNTILNELKKRAKETMT